MLQRRIDRSILVPTYPSSTARRLALVVIAASLPLAGCAAGERADAGQQDDPTSTTRVPTTVLPTTSTTSTTTTTTVPTTTTTTTTTAPTTTTTTTTTTAVEPAGALAPGIAPFTPSATATLRPGSDGPLVRELEQRLTDLGYRPGPVDESFTATTGSAVLAFQKREGIGRDRVVGGQVWSHLQAPQGPGPRDPSGHHIEVDLDRQIMFAMPGDGTVVTINISSGSGKTYQHPDGHTAKSVTPVGNFSIQRRIDGVREAPLGSLYRPLYFKGGFAVHGSPSVPAYPASHGCVRTSNIDQDWLFPLMPNRTPLSLYGSGPGASSGVTTDNPAA